MNISRPLALSVTTACLAALPVLAPATASAASATPSTTVTLKVSGCDGCTIAVYNTTSARFRNTGKPQAKSKVRSGRATFVVPTALTRGLAFTLADSGPYTSVGYHPDVALDLKGRAAGKSVSTARAKDATAARRCWAGTTKSAVTITVHSFTFRVKDYTQGNKLVTSIALWASPDLKGYGKATRLEPHNKVYPGVAQLGNQGAPNCS